MTQHPNGEPINAINLQVKKLATSRLIKVYSKEHGLLTLSGSRLGGRSEPFVHNILWVKINTNHDIHQIKHSEFQRHFSGLQADYDALTIAWHFAELIESFSHFHDAHAPELFELLYQALTALESGEHYTLTLLSFLWEFTQLTGYQPDITELNSLASERLILDDSTKQAFNTLGNRDYNQLSKEQISTLIKLLQKYLHQQSEHKLKTIKSVYELGLY